MGSVAGVGAVDENQSLSAPNYSSSRNLSHFKLKLAFWVLPVPPCARAVPYLSLGKFAVQTAFPSGPCWVWCFISFLSIPSDPRQSSSEAASFRYLESVSAQVIGPGWDVSCFTWSLLPKTLHCISTQCPAHLHTCCYSSSSEGIRHGMRSLVLLPSGSEGKLCYQIKPSCPLALRC